MHINRLKSYLTLVLLVLNINLTAAQTETIDIIEKIGFQLKSLNFESAKIQVNKSHVKNELKILIDTYINLIEAPTVKKKTSFHINRKTAKPLDITLYNLIKGHQKLYNQTHRDSALIYFKEAYTISKKNKFLELEKNSLKGCMLTFLSGVTQNDNLFKTYLNLHKKLITDELDMFWQTHFEICLFNQRSDYNEHKFLHEVSYKKRINELNRLRPKLKTYKRILFLIDCFNGDYMIKHDVDLAKRFYITCLKNLDSTPYFLGQKYRILLDLSRCEAKNGNYANAIKSLQNARIYLNEGNTIINKLNYNFFMAEYKSKIQQYDSSNYYLKNVMQLEKDLDFIEHNKTLSNLEIELKTAEKEKQILIEKQKKEQNRNIAIGLSLFLIFGSITAFLIQKNTRKKQKLAEQEKALETQKLATVLKEQELVSIDAMIEGQEKERQRIANDLHDDLGGMMATVKLHFSVFKDNQTPELFDKTTTLLDEAYQKVRTIAHAKNSGVIAKQGLLKAVQNMADKISVSNKIMVEVIDHGLENRLENSLELTIFRIIQELITNVIKHAQATEATVHLTNHEDTLNIMIEDNGIGFNPSQITTKNKGMGISSIDKRVEHLNGNMTIESENNSGTTIIIDIPI